MIISFRQKCVSKNEFHLIGRALLRASSVRDSVTRNENTFKEEVYVFHLLYGITELDMVDFASKSFDYYTSRIVKKEFERTNLPSIDMDKKQHSSALMRNETADLSPSEQQTYRYNSLQLAGFLNWIFK